MNTDAEHNNFGTSSSQDSSTRNSSRGSICNNVVSFPQSQLSLNNGTNKTTTPFQKDKPDLNKKVIKKEHNKIDGKDSAMSDDIVKAVGKLEANYEHLREHQQKLEASIEAMPSKIVESIEKKLSEQIKDLKYDIEKTTNANHSDVLLKIKESEQKILQSENKIILWVAGLIISLAIVTIIAPTLKDFLSEDKNLSSSAQPTIIMMPSNAIQPLMEKQQIPTVASPEFKPSKPEKKAQP